MGTSKTTIVDAICGHLRAYPYLSTATLRQDLGSLTSVQIRTALRNLVKQGRVVAIPCKGFYRYRLALKKED